MAICTIIAKNYLAFARTLCDSFLEHHPAGTCHVLVIDDPAGRFDPGRERFRIVSLRDLGIEGLPELCFKYNVTELSTAVKPFFIEHLFRTGAADRVLYLDPDILVTNPLDGLYGELDRADVILTPHLDKDYPEDGLFPDDGHILRSGIYNLGFIGMRKCGNTAGLLSWWKGKMRDKCLIDHGRGYFVDQRFIDLATTLFDNISVVRDPGCNVAYWNLHSRKIGMREGRWTCNGDPLRFFHFSNYRPESPHVISGHQTRYDLADLPELRALFDLYRRLLFSNGYEESVKWPYTFDRFDDGSRINDTFRKLYRISGPARRARDPFVRSGHPLSLRLLLPATAILHFTKTFLKERIKASPLFRRLLTPVLGPLPHGKPLVRHGSSRTRSR
ncbi:MAG: glycosyl transferase [Thermodesulfobacteriota bacterium]